MYWSILHNVSPKEMFAIIGKKRNVGLGELIDSKLTIKSTSSNEAESLNKRFNKRMEKTDG